MIKLFLQLTKADIPYIPLLKPLLLSRANVTFNTEDFVVGKEVSLRAAASGCNTTATTSNKLLGMLLSSDRSVSLDDFAGSIISKYEQEFLILNPLEHLVSTDTGRFIYERYFSKFLYREKWLPLPLFNWSLFTPHRAGELLLLANEATFISIDIETVRDDPDRAISCIGFSAVRLCNKTKRFTITTFVVPLDSLYNLAFARKVCKTSAPKVLQNGKYDIAYLLRYNCEPTNYLFDTVNLFHAWYSELPKRLDFITSFCLREWEYWKDTSGNWGSNEHYEYNAKDCFATAIALLSLLIEMPDWALRNYIDEFKVVHPCILAEATGIAKDSIAASSLKEKIETVMDLELKSVRIAVNNPLFNPSSPQQVLKLFEVLGSGDIKDTTPPSMDKVSNRHPLNSFLLSKITTYRKERKLLTSYMKESGAWNGRILYAINPHGTDTGRTASKESQFWCGLQIQNIPRDRPELQIKEMFVADSGFYFGEADYSQAESKGTAYISGDTNLLKAVDDRSKDFHSYNASYFFGLPYEEICSSTAIKENELDSPERCKWKHKRLDLKLIDTAKRTNHGANYNMGPQVLVDTMKIKKVLEARTLLKLPSNWTPKRVAEHLLKKFDETYPVVRGASYDKIFSDITTTKLLVGATGWTRYCFGNLKNKHTRNSYAAHPPQSLNSQLLNRAFIKVLNEIWLVDSNNFKLYGQIHDSIIFAYRIGHEYLALAVKEIMEECGVVEVTDTFGIKRVMEVGVDVKGGSRRWSEIEKIEFDY